MEESCRSAGKTPTVVRGMVMNSILGAYRGLYNHCKDSPLKG